MRIVRFEYKKARHWGVVGGDGIEILSAPPFGGIRRTGRMVSSAAVKLLAPSEPTKIILAGLNYREHAREMAMKLPKEPVIFLKPLTTVIPPGGTIVYPRGVRRLDFEAELALVIGKTGKDIPVAQAGRYILGYTCCNDATARDLQKKDGQWTRAKSFDTFCPFGPWIETGFDPSNKRIRAILNGKVKQDSSTADFIFLPEELVAFVSSVMTLYPGDLISTGTPPGIGPMRPGDRIAVEIEGIGTLVNTVSSFKGRKMHHKRKELV